MNRNMGTEVISSIPEISTPTRSPFLFDLLAFLRDKGISPSLGGKHVRPGWVGLRCPFCGDSKDHLGYNLQRGYFKCWRCGWHSIPEVLRGMLQISWAEAYHFAEQYDVEGARTYRQQKSGRVSRIEIPQELLSAPERRYLERRGFSPTELCNLYDLRGGGFVGPWKYRIVLPFYFHGKLVTCTARALSDAMEPRYLNLPEERSVLAVKETFYNIDTVWDSPVIIVVEGPTDVWRLGPGFVASCGTELSPAQLALLKQWEQVLFLFDNEDLAQQRARKYAAALSSLGVPRVEVLREDSGKDPGSLSREEAQELRKAVLL